MTAIEKQVRIRQLQEEIDKRCSFFRIMTDAGIRTAKKQSLKKQTQQHGIPRKG